MGEKIYKTTTQYKDRVGGETENPIMSQLPNIFQSTTMQWRPQPETMPFDFIRGRGGSKHHEVFEPRNFMKILVCPGGTTAFKETVLEISTHRLILSSRRL